MKQIIVIHGGSTFSKYENYLEHLKTKTVTIERLFGLPTWKNNLQSILGDSYQVLLPSMPNSTNAKYEEWKIWFERIAELAEDHCVLIGHSLGGRVLSKILM